MNVQRPILQYRIPQVILPIEELAYIAGLLDAEGALLIYKNSKSSGYTLQLVYRKTHYDTLKYIGDVFGGIVRPSKRDPKSALDVWSLMLTSRKAYYALKHIYPFLIIKRRPAQVCIEFFELYWRPKLGTGRVSDERQHIGRTYAAMLNEYKTKPGHKHQSHGRIGN